MAVCKRLNAVLPENCAYNGYLHNYLDHSDGMAQDIQDAFIAIVKKYPNMKVCVDYTLPIRKETVTNRIIHYKDAFKLHKNAFKVSYILYTEVKGKERGIVLLPYSHFSFLYAKGCYLCLSEPGGPLEDAKNELLGISTNRGEEVVELFDRLFEIPQYRLQKEWDKRYYPSFERLLEAAVHAADELKQVAPKYLLESKHPDKIIDQMIVIWFLLKKVVYVSYRMDRQALQKIHNGNVQEHRAQAKAYADAIGFMSRHDLWVLTKSCTSKSKNAVRKV